MTYDELLVYIQERHGKSETDLIKWYALSDVQGLREMSDDDLADAMMQGIKYDRTFIKRHWKDLDPDRRNEYLDYMAATWNEEPKLTWNPL